MNFYAYQYLYQQNHQPNIWGIFIICALAIALLITSYLYYKNRSDNKYRDLLIIFAFAIALFVGINYNNYERQIDVSNQTSQTLVFLNSVAKEKQVSPQKLYVSSSTLSEGMLIKIGQDFYRVSFDNNLNSYTLNRANLVDVENIKLVK